MRRTTIHNTQFYPPDVWRNASRDTKYVRRSTGSALILAVVLTSLLAVIAVTFLLNSRMDSIATSAIAENKELNFAVDTVIARISGELVADTPGITADEYYDYPDVCNPWLASLEPYQLAANDYRWRRITDLYGFLELLRRGGYLDTYYDDPVDPNNFIARLWAESAPVTGAHRAVPTIDNVDFGGPADADGDGVADSRWIRLPNITSGKGKPIYAAIRIIDNSAMLNVNTAYKFDPNTAALADGSSQSNINLLGLSWRDLTHSFIARNQRLLSFRAGLTPDPNNIPAYEQDVVWNYGTPTQMYTPFDISDELKLRNRYQINYNLMVSRIEELWESCFDGPFYVPRRLGDKLEDWFWKANYSSLDPNLYDYRHIATTDNLDRVVTPRGTKMLNVNTADETGLFDTVKTALAETTPGDVNLLAAQITANLIDYRDSDDRVTTFYDPNFLATAVYGFERPCVYISELAQAFAKLNDPNRIFRAFAVELHKPYWEDNLPANGRWRLSILDTFGFVISDIPIFWSGSLRYHVMKDDPYLLLPVVYDVNAPNDVSEPNDPVPQDITVDANLLIPGTILQLSRFVPDANTWLTVDTAVIPEVNTGWPGPNDIEVGIYNYSSQRDITRHKCIRRLWDIFYGSISATPTLGGPNLFVAPDSYLLQAHPPDIGFTNVGEIGMLFATSAYAIGTADTELNTRLNLADPAVQNIFKYLTVMDPFNHDHLATETRVKGRININTAPWFVLAQLPWVTPELARAIVAYRDKMLLEDTAGNPIANYTDRSAVMTAATGFPAFLREQPGFESVGELMNVTNVAGEDAYNMWRYAPAPYGSDPCDLTTLPDLSGGDGVPYDFEERDVIFSRISNLVTVRSDVFTAYILVRIGRDGPQKRVVAILDRSNIKTLADKVRVIALHPVADPR